MGVQTGQSTLDKLHRPVVSWNRLCGRVRNYPRTSNATVRKAYSNINWIFRTILLYGTHKSFRLALQLISKPISTGLLLLDEGRNRQYVYFLYHHGGIPFVRQRKALRYPTDLLMQRRH